MTDAYRDSGDRERLEGQEPEWFKRDRKLTDYGIEPKPDDEQEPEQEER